MLLTVLLIIFIITILLQLCYWLFVFGAFAFAKQQPAPDNRVNVSIVVAARNEFKNLRQNLSKILDQDHEKFELILVNDASTDETHELLTNLENNNAKLQTVHINETPHYSGNKKNAITKGIESAQYENLLFTDADCYPASRDWIHEMTAPLQGDKKIVLGYGAYEKHPTFINKLIRYESMLTAIQYFAYAKFGIPFMGVGRNLAYKKELFKNAGGFAAHASIRSGDDDLFINQVANKKNTAVVFSKKSFTVSKPKKSFKSWVSQKRRHITTAHHYRMIHQIMLGLFYVSQISFWLLAILLMTFSLNWQFILLLISIRFIAQYIIVTNSAIKLEEKDLIAIVPVLDILLVLTQLYIFLCNLIKKPDHW